MLVKSYRYWLLNWQPKGWNLLSDSLPSRVLRFRALVSFTYSMLQWRYGKWNASSTKITEFCWGILIVGINGYKLLILERLSKWLCKRTGTCATTRTRTLIICSFCILLNKSHVNGYAYIVPVTFSLSFQSYCHQIYDHSDSKQLYSAFDRATWYILRNKRNAPNRK